VCRIILSFIILQQQQRRQHPTSSGKFHYEVRWAWQQLLLCSKSVTAVKQPNLEDIGGDCMATMTMTSSRVTRREKATEVP